MLITYTFIIFFLLCLFIYIGLITSSTIKDNTLYMVFWFSYIVVSFGIINLIMLSFFWGAIQHKSGPPGPRGLKGDMGDTGNKGNCGEVCRTKQCNKDILDAINELYKDIKKDKKANITNEFILNKVKQMCHSKEYEVTAPIKGPNNLHEYMINIWKDWIRLIYNNNGDKFLRSKFADIYNYSWLNNNNPVIEMEKYDIFNWGLSQLFKGIGIGVCQYVERNNYFPSYHKKEIDFIETNCYEIESGNIQFDYSRNRNEKMAVFTPKKYVYQNEVYYPISQIVVKFDNISQIYQDITKKYYKYKNNIIDNFSITVSKIRNLNNNDNIRNVVLYSNNNFTGEKKRLKLVKNENFSMIINSIEVPEGFTVFIFNNHNYSGNKMRFDGSQKTKYNNLNNFNVKSIIITLTNLGLGPARASILLTGNILKKPIDYQLIWTNSYFKGVILAKHYLYDCNNVFHHYRNEGYYQVDGNPNISNDDLSAVIVSAGYEIIIYENYGSGNTLHIKGPALVNITSLNDEISSWRIIKNSSNTTFQELSIWRPIAPKGFVCLSDLFVKGYNRPSISEPEIMCVREDIVELYNVPVKEKPNIAGFVYEYPYRDKHKGWEKPLFSHIGLYNVSSFNDNKYPNLHYQIPNDDVDSIKVLPGFEITLYEHINGEGFNRKFKQGNHELKNTPLFNGVSSIKIDYIGNKNIDNKNPNTLFESKFEDYFKKTVCKFYSNMIRHDKKSFFTILGYIDSLSGKCNNSNLFGSFRVEKGTSSLMYNRRNNIPSTSTFYKLNLGENQKYITQVRNTDFFKNTNNLEQKKNPMSSEMYSELGIGWHGDPVREPKYSIFTYLNMMPESIISHRASDRKYYITHSGKLKFEEKEIDGKKIKQTVPENSYVILKYNIDSERYDLALSVNKNNDSINIKEGSKVDDRQLWKVEFLGKDNKNEFRLKSKLTKKYLKLDISKNLRGKIKELQTVHKGINSNPDEKTIFHNNKSAYGPSLDILRNYGTTKKDKIVKNNQTPRRYIQGIYDPKNN